MLERGVHREWMGALALSLLLPAAAAQAAEPLLGNAVAATGGVGVDGHALAWVLPSHPGGSGISLRAGTVDVYAHEWTVVGPGNGSPPIKPVRYTDAMMSATPWDGAGFLQVIPATGGGLPAIRFETPALSLAADTRQCLGDPSPPEIRTSPTCYDTRAGGDVHQAEVRQMTFSGSFQVKLWGWNGSIQGSNGGASLWSGHDQSPVGPQSMLTADHWGLLHLRVSDGTLTVALGRDGTGDLVLRDATLKAGGATTLVQPHGPGRLVGPTPFAVSFQDSRVAVVQPQEAQALAQGPLSGLSWGWLALAALLGLGAGAAAVARLFRPRDPVLKALHEGDPIKAARLAALGGPSLNAEQAVTRAVAYIRTGAFDLAERELCAYALPAADLKFMTACLRARQGREQEARHLLSECVALQPAYAAEIQLNPDLTRLWGSRAPDGPEGYI
jgi:hypothetical protein